MKSKNSEGSQERRTIMVVDDDEALRLMLQSHLEKYYDVVLKCDGHEAMVYLTEDNIPDLILLDMEMPVMNGRVFLRRLRYGNNKVSKIPVIFISAITNKPLIDSASKMGAYYVTKPFEIDNLIEKIEEVLELESGGSE